ncbi:hypothetical protein [Streptomyces sp. cmx-4-9]|uniref:hypothetical protein n=1 Tax=Streptomyces sp. cmx-4-9 TaxID=2790941 RepID=UPI00397FEFFF
MGGREHTQGGRRGRPATRRAVLPTASGVLAGVLAAVLAGALAGALFLCARPGAAGVQAASGDGHVRHARPAGHAPDAGHVRDTGPAGHASDAGYVPDARPAGHVRPGAPAGYPAGPVCLSPSGPPGCSGSAHVTPGVLPVPPPAVAGGRTGPVPGARPAVAPRPRPAGTLARAPDLHALQVLRT